MKSDNIMSYYFGFKPSQHLSSLVEEMIGLIQTDLSNTGLSYSKQPHSADKEPPYYILRNKTAHQIGRELIDNMMVDLIEVIPNPERKAIMRKLVNMVESSTDTILNLLLSKDSNEEVVPNIYYLKDDTAFIDDKGNKRIGCKLEDDVANMVLAAFDNVLANKQTPENIDMQKLEKSLKNLNHSVINHFVSQFAKTLPLGLVKRKSVALAQSGVNKGLDVAIHRLLPQLDNAGLQRIVNFYRPFIFQV